MSVRVETAEVRTATDLCPAAGPKTWSYRHCMQHALKEQSKRANWQGDPQA